MSKLKYYDGSQWKVVNGQIVGVTNEYSSSTTNAYSCKYVNDLVDNEKYSTTETKTNKVWVDGKPIYRKVVNFGSLPNTTTKTVSHGLSVSTTRFISVTGTAYDSNGNTFLLPSPRDTVALSIYMNLTSDGKIAIQAGSDRSSFNAYVILEYTKNN